MNQLAREWRECRHMTSQAVVKYASTFFIDSMSCQFMLFPPCLALYRKYAVTIMHRSICGNHSNECHLSTLDQLKVNTPKARKSPKSI